MNCPLFHKSCWQLHPDEKSWMFWAGLREKCHVVLTSCHVVWRNVTWRATKWTTVKTECYFNFARFRELHLWADQAARLFKANEQKKRVYQICLHCLNEIIIRILEYIIVSVIRVLSCGVTSWHVVWRHVTWCYVMARGVTSWHVVTTSCELLQIAAPWQTNKLSRATFF